MLHILKSSVWPILVVVVLLGCSRDPNKLIESGKKYIAEGKYREATIELRSAIQLSAQSAEAHYQLARAYLYLGSIADANQELNQTVLLQYANLDAQLIRGYLLLLDRNFREAKDTAEYILQRDASNIRAQILLGNSYSGLVQRNDSLGELKNSFEVEPALSAAYMDLSVGNANWQRQPEAAEAAYKKAITMDTRSALPHSALASFYLQSQRTADAESEFKTAAALDPMSSDAQQALALFYASAGKSDLAEQIYSGFARSRPNDLDQQVRLADFYNGIGKPEQAIEVLTKVAAKDPKYLPAKRRLVDLHLQQNQYGKAAEIADEFLKEAPNDPDVQFIKGRVLVAQKNTTEAIEVLQKVVKLRPLAAAGRFFLGSAYAQAQDFQRAEAEYSAAVQNDSTFVRAYLPLAELKLKGGDPETAARYARQALGLNPRLSEAHLILSRALITQKNYPDAAAEIKAVLDQQPGSVLAKYHQALLSVAQGNLPQAQLQLEAAFKTNPDQADILGALAGVYLQRNMPDKAIQTVQQAISQHPDKPDYYKILAQLFLTRNSKMDAEQAFEKAVSLDARDVYQRIALADFYVRTGSFEKAVSTLENVIREDQRNAVAKPRLAELYLRNKDYDKALKTAEDLKATSNTDALVIKARVLLAQTKRKMQSLSCKKQCEANPPPLWPTTIWVRPTHR